MTFTKKLSLAGKLLVILSGISLGGMAITALMAYQQSEAIVLKNARNDIENRIKAADSSISIAFEENTSRLKELSSNLARKYASRISVSPSATNERTVENQETHDRHAARPPHLLLDGKRLDGDAVVDEIATTTGSDATFFVTIPEGLLRESTSLKKADGSRAIGTYIPTTSPVYQSLARQEPYYGRAVVLGRWYYTAYLPVIRDGRLVAAIFVGSPDTSAERVKSYLRKEKIGETGYFFVLDSKGTTIIHPTLEGKNILELTDADNRPIFREIIEKKNGTLDYHWKNAEGVTQRKFAIYRHFSNFDWYVASSVTTNELLRDVRALQVRISVTIAILTLAMVAIVFLVARRMGSSFTSIAVKLQAGADQVAQAADQVAKSSQSLSSGSTEQAASLQETSSSLEELSSMIQRNNDNAGVAADCARRSLENAESGRKTIETILEAIRKLESSNQQIGEIAKVFSEIQQKTTVIDDIVFQTQLLSFNASVEAARAGEHGKGFAVVAEEVGNLAEMSGGASNEIGELLSGSAKKVEKTVSEVRERIEHLVRSAAQGSEALMAIVKEAQTVSEKTKEIAVASQEQSQGVSGINQAVHELDKVTQQNNSISQETASASERLAEQSGILKNLVIQLQREVEGRRAS